MMKVIECKLVQQFAMNFQSTKEAESLDVKLLHNYVSKELLC